MFDVTKFAGGEWGEARFAVEYLRDIVEEIKPLHLAHWQETEAYRHGQGLDMDYPRMIECEQYNNFMQFTVRRDGRLIGNCGIYVFRSMHTKKPEATEDTIFILSEERKGRLGIKFMEYVEKTLKLIGIEHLRVTVKRVNDVGRLLKLRGYEHVADELVKVL